MLGGYFPWGADRFTSGATLTSFKFTGQREEAAIGLYYDGAPVSPCRI